MKRIFTAGVILLVWSGLTSCNDEKKQERLTIHMEDPAIQNFQVKPELDLYLGLMEAKTHTTVTDVDIKFDFKEKSDSILNVFSVSMRQDSLDVNHRDLPREMLLEQIAKDIKPMISSYQLFQRLSIVLTTPTADPLPGNTQDFTEIVYKRELNEIPEGSNYQFAYLGDTIQFKDAYYNGIQAHSGKIRDKKQVGFWEYWYPDGKKKKEGYFDNDSITGDWKYWDKTGKELANIR